MARLSKREIAAHREAESLIALDRPLTDDEREFVIENWQESARHINSAAGAFFTPWGLALDAAVYAVWWRERPPRVLDLCAGIGTLGLACHWRSGGKAQITCLEVNPDYVAIGRRLLPEANWIQGNANELPADLGQFDVVISNPPFGRTARLAGPRFSGADELAAVDIAADLAPRGAGVFILPVNSLPFEFSRRGYREKESLIYERFSAATGIDLEGSSMDSELYADKWRGVRPQVEIVTTDFEERRRVDCAAAA